MSTPFRGFWLLAVVVMLSACGGNSWQDQHGNSISDEDLSGRPLLVNYWAEWCGPCRDELPELNALAEARPDVAVLGINFDGIEGEALAALSDEMGRWVMDHHDSEQPATSGLLQHAAEAMRLIRPQVLPTTYLLDPQGNVLRTLQGPQDEAALLAALDEAEVAP